MMTTKQRIRKIAAARQAELEAAETVEREMCSLKPGDMVWFVTGFDEVIDAYPISQYTMVVKLLTASGRTETHRFRTIPGRDNTITCRV